MDYKLLAWYIVTTLALLLVAGTVYANRHPKLVFEAEAEEVKETWESQLTPELRKLALCESGMNPTALNAVDTNGKRSVGLLQFQDATFIQWAKAIDPYKKWDIWNPEHQIQVAKWAFIHNYQRHWGCWKKIVL